MTATLTYKDVDVHYKSDFANPIRNAVVAIIENYYDDEFQWEDLPEDGRVFYYCRGPLDFFEMTLAGNPMEYYFVELKEDN